MASRRSDPSLALRVINAKEDVNRLADQMSDRLLQRLIAEDPHRTATFRIESQLIEHFKRIYYFAKRIAKLVAEAEVAEGDVLPVGGEA